MKSNHPFLWTLAVIILIALGVFTYEVTGPKATEFAGGKSVALSEYRGADPTGVPAELQNATQIEKGEYLTRAADCMVCHTTQDGAAYAGGRAFVLPFGTLYSTNITADTETGIGGYPPQEFLRCTSKGPRPHHPQQYSAQPLSRHTPISDPAAPA